MPVQPETHEDTVLYGRRTIYGDNDLTVRMLDGASLNIWGEAYLNGQLIAAGQAIFDVKDYGAVGDGVQNSIGGFTITWSSAYKVNWTPVTTPFATNVIEFLCNGTNWYQTSATTGL